jgi:hypothetical protein
MATAVPSGAAVALRGRSIATTIAGNAAARLEAGCGGGRD